MASMASNRGVVFLGPNHIEVQSIDYPKLENPAGKRINHGVILRVVSTNICGSDQHIVRGRAPPRPSVWSSVTRLPAKSSNSAPTSSTSKGETSSQRLVSRSLVGP